MSIEFSTTRFGLFSNLVLLVEWLWLLDTHKISSIYVNMFNKYKYNGNIFTLLFTSPSDPRFYLEPIADREMKQIVGQGTYHLNLPYNSPSIYGSESFRNWRHIAAPLIETYLRPARNIQEQINHLKSDGSKYRIGIHIRCAKKYQPGWDAALDKNVDNYTKLLAEYRGSIERDIDRIMAGKDPDKTEIYLSTLVEPIFNYIVGKYNVVFCEMPRYGDDLDWENIDQLQSPAATEQIIIDTWSLAACDEIWGGSSFMFLFASLIKPDLPVFILPTLARHDGL